MNLQPPLHIQHTEDRADGRMLNIGCALAVFDLGMDHPQPVLEEGRQVAASDEAILVNRRPQHGAAILPVPCRVVGASAEEGDAERCAADHHNASQPPNCCAHCPPGQPRSAPSRPKTGRAIPAVSRTSIATPSLTAVTLAISGSNII